MKINEIDANFGFQPDTQVKKKKKKTKKNFFWLKFIIVIVLSVSALVSLGLSPIFNIKQIVVYGNEHYNKEEIIPAVQAGIPIGSNGFKTIGSSVKNILTLRYGNTEKKIIEAYPYIKKATIRFAVPGKVKIYLTERQPMALIPYLGTNLVIDDEGVIVDTLEALPKSSMPTIIGLKFKRYEVGQSIQVDNPEGLNKAADLVKTVAKSDLEDSFKLLELIKNIDIGSIDKVSINIDGRITVNLGNLDNLTYRLMFLKQIYKNGIKEDEKGYLDFTNGENPNFIPEIN